MKQIDKFVVEGVEVTVIGVGSKLYQGFFQTARLKEMLKGANITTLLLDFSAPQSFVRLCSYVYLLKRSSYDLAVTFETLPGDRVWWLQSSYRKFKALQKAAFNYMLKAENKKYIVISNIREVFNFNDVKLVALRSGVVELETCSVDAVIDQVEAALMNAGAESYEVLPVPGRRDRYIVERVDGLKSRVIFILKSLISSSFLLSTILSDCKRLINLFLQRKNHNVSSESNSACHILPLIGGFGDYRIREDK